MQDELATLGHINILSCLYTALLQGHSTQNSYAAPSVGSQGAEGSTSERIIAKNSQEPVRRA